MTTLLHLVSKQTMRNRLPIQMLFEIFELIPSNELARLANHDHHQHA